MTITALPTPPSRNDPANFAERGDAFLGALPTFVTEANALQVDVNSKQSAAATSASNAATSATNSANSATAAGTSATNAANSATAASTSATNAANSATAAANSASAASTSATAAANSATQAATTLSSKANLSGAAFTGPISATALDSTPIGQTTPAAGKFTSLQSVQSIDNTAVVESTGVSAAAAVHVRTGNGTTSGKYAYVRFQNSDTNNQDWRIGTYANDNFSLVNAKAGATALTVDTSSRLTVGPANATGATLNTTIYQAGYSTAAQLRYLFNHAGQGVLGIGSDGAGAMVFGRTSTTDGAVTNEFGRFDGSGNLLLGVTSGSAHTISHKNVVEGNMNLNLNSNASFYICGAGGSSTAASGMQISKSSTTSRSINAAGTVNASGADYAEYMRKAENCGTISKGAIVGVNAAGELTDKWADAVSFVVKSTDPSYVGGDTWGSEEALGLTRPTEPQRKTAVTEQRLVSGIEGSTTEEYETIVLEAGDTDEEWEAKQAAYQAALQTFEDTLEAARQQVDRIAYAGQVPVNVVGATPGQYVVPVQDGDGIGAILVDEDDMTLKQYIKAVGIVQNILEDGRANVRVKVA